MVATHGLSILRSCQTLDFSRSVYHYQPNVDRDEPVIQALLALVERYPRYGFRKLFLILRREGHGWSHKRVHRVYCRLNLNLHRKGRQRLPSRDPRSLTVPEQINQCWSVDFMSDALYCGRRLRAFSIVDDYNREAFGIEIDLNLQAPCVIRTLEHIAASRGYPGRRRLDNGPELVAVALAERAEGHGVELDFIEPGKPAQNSFIERFNHTYRNEVLDFHVFRTLEEVREVTDRRLIEYNEERPYESLNDLTPVEYRQ